jgi:murein DD-endopeptidase MepM/ murein hydrolase activator NlpD
MKYTVRYAHLKEEPPYRVGATLKQGDEIGVQGNTGASDGAHLHIDVVEGEHSYIYKLSDIDVDRKPGKLFPNITELNFFIDKDIYKADFKISTFYCEPEYQKVYGKLHPAYDLVCRKLRPAIYWNRSFIGRVTKVGWDDSYGWHVYVVYEK